jgi:ribonuclease P/MRP protein subunit POP5
MVRFKARYLLFRIHFENNVTLEHLTSQQLFPIIKSSLLLHFGTIGLGLCSSLHLKYFSPFTNIGILRISREEFRKVWASLTFIHTIQNVRCSIQVVHVSGTIKSIQKEIIFLNERALLLLSKGKSLSLTLLYRFICIHACIFIEQVDTHLKRRKKRKGTNQSKCFTSTYFLS